jgi:hypothetical protein
MSALMHDDEKKTRNQHIKNNHKNHLTRPSVCTLLFCVRAAAIAFAPKSPTWLLSCKNSCRPSRTAMKKQTRNQQINSKQSQNSYYKVQRLHAAVLLQSGGNSFCSFVADSVFELQNSC